VEFYVLLPSLVDVAAGEVSKVKKMSANEERVKGGKGKGDILLYVGKSLD
jgi:hypothetical protein